ncbi:glycosyltransferase [Sphingomonas guangdongensis]|uniref:glycosyltransferase n=1 Tax=Sphingomonas guangdongensis TaxID=1141890 RepID=UPI0015CA6F38|nr:glycosyltransferase [Sphingomonas guangdongensis]
MRNEVELLPRFLRALAKQRDAGPVTLAVFFDDCDDGSEALVASFKLPFAVVTDCARMGGRPNAGRARRRAMALAMEAVPGGALLTTDADSAPAPDWIAAFRRGLAQADVVAGRILTDAGQDSPTQGRLGRYYDRLHTLRRALDPVAWEAPHTHHWGSAASLAIRADVYQAVGGFADMASGEDAALLDAAARGGWRLRRDADVRVTTSSRRTGRVPGGFAAALSAWDDDRVVPTVTHPADEAWRYTQHAQARALHGGKRFEALADTLRLSLAEVEQVAAECRNGEAFAARIVGAPPGGMRQVSLAQAEQLLGALEGEPLEVVA